MLSGDYLSYVNLDHDRGLGPHCRMCQVISELPAPPEDLTHILTSCRATADTRTRIMPTLLNTVSDHYPRNRLLVSVSHEILTQFILDCSSLNLPNDVRIHPNHPGYLSISQQCSNLVYGIHKDRTRQLKALGLLGKVSY